MAYKQYGKLPWGRVSVDPAFIEITSRTNISRRKKPMNPMLHPTPLVHTKSFCALAVQVFFSQGPVFEGAFISALDYSAFPSEVTIAKGLNLANLKIRKDMKEEVVNLAVVLAEYRQTCSMFASVASEVVFAFRNARRGDLAGIIRSVHQGEPLSKRAADRWLQFNYGFFPVMNDVRNSARILAKALHAPDGVIRRSRATHSLTFNLETSLPDRKVAYVYPDIWWRGGRAVASHTYDCSYHCVYKVKPQGVSLAAQLGLTNPALVAWELIPYSFVVDWLIPVGDWLSSLDALVGIEILNTQSIVKGKSTCKAGWSTFSTATSELYRRQNVQNLPVPALVYDPSTSLKAVLNGLSLLRQLR